MYISGGRIPNDLQMTTSDETLRVDRWLFFCRFFKTRSLAAAAVNGGHVRVNGERASSGLRVRPGDQVELVRDRLRFKLRVKGVPARRGPAREARQYYEEDPASKNEREEMQEALRQDRLLMPSTQGRPDKHTRRKLRTRNRNE